MLKQANDMQTTIDTMTADAEHHGADGRDHAQHGRARRRTWPSTSRNCGTTSRISTTSSGRIRNYFYWEPHCYDIPICWSIRSIFDTLDGIDTLTDDIQNLLPDLEQLDTLMPQMVALMPSMIETMKNMKNITLTMYQSQKSQQDQMKAMQENQTAMGQAFDASKNDDSFYLPPEVFDNADFKRGMKMFVSPDGKAVRFIISHEGDPATPEGIKLIHADQERGVRGHQGHAVGGLEDLSGGHRVHVQGHAGGFELRPADRRNMPRSA